MTVSELLSIVWVRRRAVLAIVLVATASAYAVGRALPEVYTARAKLFISYAPGGADSLERLQSAQALTKTYAELLQAEGFARTVAAKRPGRPSVDELLDQVAFKPLLDTQLIDVMAEGDTPAAAAELANMYATEFTSFVQRSVVPRTGAPVTLVDRAEPPDNPTRPKPGLYAAIMFALSLFLGAAFAVVRDRLDPKLGSKGVIAAALGAPVLAVVPERPPSITGSYLEAMRLLLMNLGVLRGRRGVPVIAIACAAAGEGGTGLARDLATVMAQEGHEVLLVEGDLRHPVLRRMVGLRGHRQDEGLAHYLAAGAGFDTVTQETRTKGLSVVFAGAATPNPEALLRRELIDEFLDSACERFNAIIIDLPPADGADAEVLAAAAGDVMIVVNQQLTNKTRAAEAAAALRKAGATVVGSVVIDAGSAPAPPVRHVEPNGAGAPLPPREARTPGP